MFIGHKTIDFLLVRGCFNFLHMFNRIVFLFPICNLLYSLDRNFFVIIYLLLLYAWPCYFANGISFLFLAALGFIAAQGLSLVAVSRGYSLVVVHRLLIAVAALIAEHGFSCSGGT